MTECWIIVIDGNASNAGVILHLIDLSGAAIGPNGLLLVRDDVSIAILPPPDPATTLVLHDFNPDLINTTATFVLAAGTPWFAPLFDLDFDNNGVLDSPLFMTVHDAVSYSDGGANDYEYAGQLANGLQLGTHNGATRPYTPDAIYRILTDVELHHFSPAVRKKFDLIRGRVTDKPGKISGNGNFGIHQRHLGIVG